jgi:hypothetical protein
MRPEDWPSFEWRYALDLRRLVPHIMAIEEYKAALLRPALPPHWLEVPPALEAAALAAEHAKGAGSAKPLHDTRVAQVWVRQRFAPGSPPISLADIFAIHWMVAEAAGAKGKGAGVLRTLPCEVGREEVGGVHHGAPCERLPVLMEEYLGFVNGAELRCLPPVMQALLAHYFLDTIHPFLDGNGRTSRLVAAALLSQQGYNLHGTYALVRHFYRHQIAYHRILHASWKRCPFEVTPFVAFGMEGFVLELKGVDSFIKLKLDRIVDSLELAPAVRRKISASPPH